MQDEVSGWWVVGGGQGAANKWGGIAIATVFGYFVLYLKLHGQQWHGQQLPANSLPLSSSSLLLCLPIARPQLPRPLPPDLCPQHPPPALNEACVFTP